MPKARPFLKGQRYNLLRNPENLSAEGRRQLDLLLEANRDLSVVYLLKDAFKAVWTYTYRKCAEKRLTGWIQMALESGVGELARFARGLEEAREQILNFCQHRITSARIEAFNTIVSRVMHKSLWRRQPRLSLSQIAPGITAKMIKRQESQA